MKLLPATNKREWNAYIKKVAPHSYFQAWEWGEIERASGNTVWRLQMVNANGTVIGLSQIVKISARRGTFLHVRHGPIFATWRKQYLQNWLHEVENLARKEGAWFIRISPMIDSGMSSFLVDQGFAAAPIHSMDAEHITRLDLRHSDDELMKQMRKTTRNLIRRAKKDGVEVRVGSDIDEFLSLYKKTADRHHFVPHGQIEEEFKHFKKRGNAVILNGYHEDTLIASAMVVAYGNQAMYRHGASIRSRVPVAYLVQWEAIAWAREKNMKIYNFWGIANTDSTKHPWWGLTRFKLGFGGETVSYLHAHDRPLTPRYYITYAIERLRKIKRGY